MKLCIVEGRRIALSGSDQRQQFGQIVAEKRTFEKPFARLERIQIAAQRVDLPIVRQIPVRMREAPGRERVGAVPLMNDGERRGEVRIVKIRIELFELGRQQKSFVDDAPA